MKSIKVLIPAAGSGSRLGLKYPKTLIKINSKTILENLVYKFKLYDRQPTVIFNFNKKKILSQFIKNSQLSIEHLFQKNPKGMGHSVLQIKKSKKFKETDNIILIWGDIPFLQTSTINYTISEHFKNNNDFTFPTIDVHKPYTLVNRDKFNNVISVNETREIKNKKASNFGEREIGFFIFKKNVVINLLSKNLLGKINKITGEHGFLYIIEHLILKKYKVKALKIAKLKDTISINTAEDLEKLNKNKC